MMYGGGWYDAAPPANAGSTYRCAIMTERTGLQPTVCCKGWPVVMIFAVASTLGFLLWCRRQLVKFWLATHVGRATQCC
jgi:hypothetical protein